MATRNPARKPPFGCIKPWKALGFQLPFPQLVFSSDFSHQQYLPTFMTWPWVPNFLKQIELLSVLGFGDFCEVWEIQDSWNTLDSIWMICLYTLLKNLYDERWFLFEVSELLAESIEDLLNAPQKTNMDTNNPRVERKLLFQNHHFRIHVSLRECCLNRKDECLFLMMWILGSNRNGSMAWWFGFVFLRTPTVNGSEILRSPVEVGW